MNLIESINAQPVTKEDLLLVAGDIAYLHGDKDAFHVAMYCVVDRFKGQPNKASAVAMRMMAMARYIEGQAARSWTLPKESDGAIPTKVAVIAAAAIHPLVLVGNQLEFEPASFASRILEMAESEGQA